MQDLRAPQQTTWLATLLLMLLAMPAFADDAPQLRITGNASDAVSDNIRALVDLSRYPCEPPTAQYGLIRRQILANSQQALQAMGYYESTLSLSTDREDGCVRVTLDVDTGPAVILQRADIRIGGDAANDPVFNQLVANAQLAIGQRLQHDQYTALKKNLQQHLISRGYVQGRLTRHRLSVDTRKRLATMTLHVDSGPRYDFGAITITGSELKDKLVNAYLGFTQGEPFNSKQLLETQQAFLGAGYFSAVRVKKGTPDDSTRTIPVSITLTDNNRWSLLAGVGASTDTGPRVRLGVENRRVNRAGHRFRAETEVSQVQQGAGASYQIPLKDPQRERLDFHTSYVNEVTDSKDNERWTTGADYIVELQNRWVTTTSLTYLRETYEIAEEVDQAELIIPGFQLSRVKANDPIYPSFGWRLSSKIRFANRNLSSTASFVQLTGNGKILFPLLGGRVLVRGDLGYTEVTDVRELPASIRFFAGGDSSVRGFAYESLGPRADNGEVIGGRHLATGSLEYDHPITEKWHLAVFTDGGNAFNDFDDFEIRRSAGFGIRWRSPLGPIRLDLARAVDEQREWRLHLSMGPDL
ncbi:autotransporter assembly complex protein TamA [Alcanivorax jadensis]|uniref:autotransporter assembly complex protein TamA n=1 Tax=Alcanivorax jadensis TaxID=64988 RepID=UPI00235220F1|nr:autotransporter assembly complex family protein [Alcanivorax jadensis]